jgi:hypothetical protein
MDDAIKTDPMNIAESRMLVCSMKEQSPTAG